MVPAERKEAEGTEVGAHTCTRREWGSADIDRASADKGEDRQSYGDNIARVALDRTWYSVGVPRMPSALGLRTSEAPSRTGGEAACRLPRRLTKERVRRMPRESPLRAGPVSLHTSISDPEEIPDSVSINSTERFGVL